MKAIKTSSMMTQRTTAIFVVLLSLTIADPLKKTDELEAFLREKREVAVECTNDVKIDLKHAEDCTKT